MQYASALPDCTKLLTALSPLPIFLSDLASGLGGLLPFSFGHPPGVFSPGVLTAIFSFPASEFSELLTLCPGVGDEGFGPATPLSDAFCESGPSDERMLRVAGGSALEGGCFLVDLKRKDMSAAMRP